MSKFNNNMTSLINSLTGAATVHKETGAITFETPKDFFPKGITQDSLNLHVNFINNAGVAMEAAVSELAITNYPEAKLTKWDGELDLGCLTLNAGIQLQEELEGQDPMFGITQSFTDYRFSDDLNTWYGDFAEANRTRAAALFAND